MGKYTLVVASKPVAGMENEYNDWYTNEHLADVLKTPGFKSARRLRLCPDYENDLPYLVHYEIDTDNPQATMDLLMARSAAGEWRVSEALGPATITLFEHITPTMLAE